MTGAAGFIGAHVAAQLAGAGSLRNGAGTLQPISELVLADRAPARAPAARRTAVRVETGDVSDPAFLARVAAPDIDSVFHLAATLTIEAEQDFVHGMAVNVHALMRLLELCRAGGRRPRFVYASSIAAFGGPLPRTVDDSVAQTPQTSYGTSKAIAELLINDYSRHGFIDGRALRLPFVLIRPSASAGSMADRVAAIVREPLLGRDAVCALSPQTRIPVASARCVASALLAVHELPASAFGPSRGMNLPSLTVTIEEMVEALPRFAGGRRLGRVTWGHDAKLQAVVDSWPAAFVSERASRHGIGADASFAEIVGAFVEDHLPA